jgi:hypothetical protein
MLPDKGSSGDDHGDDGSDQDTGTGTGKGKAVINPEEDPEDEKKREAKVLFVRYMSTEVFQFRDAKDKEEALVFFNKNYARAIKGANGIVTMAANSLATQYAMEERKPEESIIKHVQASSERVAAWKKNKGRSAVPPAVEAPKKKIKKGEEAESASGGGAPTAVNQGGGGSSSSDAQPAEPTAMEAFVLFLRVFQALAPRDQEQFFKNLEPK